MDERQFISLIDCNFPYLDSRRWKKLIDLGVRISPNAAFMVLHEICTPPGALDRWPSADVLRNIFEYWKRSFSHPLLPALIACAEACIERRAMAAERILVILDEIENHAGEYCALAIAARCCDDDIVQQRREDILATWNHDHPAE